MRLIGRLALAPTRERSRASRTLFVLATVFSCGAALIGASSAAAGPAFSQTSAFVYDGFNTCTAEAFTGTGTLRMDVNENVSTTGAIQYHMNTRIDGLKAVTITGKKYVVQDTLNHEFVFSGADEDTYDMTVHYIRVGEDGSFVWGDDFYEYMRTHITTNSLGVVTAFQVSTSDAPCQ
jgi:hypothetical protein